MKNYIPIQGGKKKIFEIADEDISKYKLIGSAGGYSLEFCIYLGWKHSENFIERVCGYHIDEHGIGEMMSAAAKEVGLPENKQKYITVSFYEQEHE